MDWAPIPFEPQFSKKASRTPTFSAQQILSGSIQVGQNISSANFETGVSGWQITGDGDAEFNNVVVRGTIVAGTGSSVDWSYIQNVSIVNADIQSLSFDKITAASNTASLTVGSGGVLKSSNFSTGVSGWQITGAGDAEFNGITVRGTFTNAASGRRIAITSTDIDRVIWYTGHANEQTPGFITTANSEPFVMSLYSPDPTGTGQPASIGLVPDTSTGTKGRVVLSPPDGGQVAVDGASTSSSTPAIANLVDLDTGIYWSAANEIAFATGGTYRGKWDSSGNLVVTGSVLCDVFGEGDDYFQISEAGNWGRVVLDNGERFRVDTSGNLYSNTTAVLQHTGGYTYVKVGTGVMMSGDAVDELYIVGVPYAVGDYDLRCVDTGGGGRQVYYYAISSTRDKKTDIEYVDVDGLDVIRKLRPARWRYKFVEPDDVNAYRVSLIAEDALEAGGEDLIERHPDGTISSLYDRGIQAHLIAAIQQLDQRLDRLEERMAKCGCGIDQ